MTNQLTTIEGFKLVDLCKAGGLQDVFQISVDASSELLDPKNKKDRTRMRSLSAKTASSKVLFVNALKNYIKEKESKLADGKKEIKLFEVAMNELRDERKAPAIAMDKLLGDELEAYVMAEQMRIDADKAADDAKYKAQAMVNAELEAFIQNIEFNTLDIYDRAKMHCENKGRVFDLAVWQDEQHAEQVIKENELAAEKVAPEITSYLLQKKQQRFVMPKSENFDPAGIKAVLNGMHKVSLSIDFTKLAAEEDLVRLFPVIGATLAAEIILAIKNNKINSVEWVG